MRLRRSLTALARTALAMGAMIGASVSASAQGAAAGGELTLELNTQKDVDGGCRLTYVAVNGTTTALDEVSYEVVVFDGDKRISQFVILEFGSLPVQKTKVVQFDIANSKCADISRLVINNASRCVSAGATLPLCLDAVKPTSRTDIALGL